MMIISELSKSIAIMHRAKYLADENIRLILFTVPALCFVLLRSVGKHLQNKINTDSVYLS